MCEQAGVAGRNLPPLIYACGFSIWKKPIVRQFFAGSHVVFVRSASRVPPSSALAVWGRKSIPGKLREGVKLIHLEDGFLRSVGLGADLIQPVSWVIDTSGIYFDATQPSDLEVLLQTTEFSSDLLARASRLGERIVNTGLTKYNVGNAGWHRPEYRPQTAALPSPLPNPLPLAGEGTQAVARRVILVPGQVESDASLRFGAPGIRTNLGLLRAVRGANPDAYVLYKPHPDVVAGLRRKGDDEDEADHWCDEVVVDVAMGELLPKVDEVHTLTSLAGFEALLRGKKVVCFGQPFYAGWGMTLDVVPVARRSRRLSLDMLVAGTLILYPTYVSRTTGLFTTPECALDDLLAWRSNEKTDLSWWRNVYRFVLGKILQQQ
jgi:capsular polysaccharide export protein